MKTKDHGGRPLVGLVVTFLAIGLAVVVACPSDCSCKWKGGKQSAECVNKGLRTFPAPIEAGTQVLDVSGNSFETLPKDHFMRSGLINLQKIYLSKCRLSHIDSRAFRGLSNLVDLDLSYNMLQKVPSGAFPDCKGLMRLVLSGNPIVEIHKNAFGPLQSVTTLELGNCAIEIVEKGAFEGLLSLEWLRLNGNKLKRLDGLKMLPVPLKGVRLEDNPWDCDCRLLELRLWLQQRNVANAAGPRCATPEPLTNQSLIELPVRRFACIPQLSPTTMYQKIDEGKNVSLLCKVSSIPESTLEWWFNGQPVSNTSVNMVVDSHFEFNPTMTDSHFNPLRSTSTSHLSAIERKSELLILNATSDENGTFSCVARNPAGLAVANFTLRVLASTESDLFDDTSGLPFFIATYPNLFIIVLSTVAVISVVIVLLVIFTLICKCSRICGKRSDRDTSSCCDDSDHHHHNNSHGHSGSKKSNTSAKCKGNKKGKKDTDSNGGTSGNRKLDRHLSETSTLTTHTKSNGSVFLLSTSSELGDSNPDLIEGVKRVDSDGNETCFSHFNSPSPNCYSSGSMGNNNGGREGDSPQIATSYHYGTLPHHHHHMSGNNGSTTTTGITMETPIHYPMEYGLPKSLNVTTLVRRSPSYPSGNVLPVTSTSSGGNATLPPSYDLAKYPKEYINPQESNNTMMSPYGYIGETNSPYPPPTIMCQAKGEFFPAYILSPEGYMTNFTGEEYTVATMGYGQNVPPPPLPPTVVPMNCSCAPILEASESEEKIEAEGGSNQGTQTGTELGDNNGGTPGVKKGGSVDTSTSSCSSSSNASNGGTGKGSSSVSARLQRQLSTQINESPDEGYEDGSAEGTEI